MEARGYLWTNLRQEIAEELSVWRFPQRHGRTLSDDGSRHAVGFQHLRATEKWATPDPAEALVDPWDWKRHRSKVLKTGVLPNRRRRQGRPSSVEAAKIELKKIREERKRKKGMGEREKLPNDREGTTSRFTMLVREEQPDGSATIREMKGYIQANTYADGRLGEFFVRVGKPGSSEAWLDTWAIACSIALQHGASVDELLGKFVGQRFEPSGSVKWLPGVDRCTSMADMVSRFLISRYGNKET